MKFSLLSVSLIFLGSMSSGLAQNILPTDEVPKGDYVLEPLPFDMKIKANEQKCGNFFVTTAHPDGGLAVIFKYRTVAPSNAALLGAFARAKFKTIADERYKVPSVELVTAPENEKLVVRVIVHISKADFKKATPCIPSP